MSPERFAELTAANRLRFVDDKSPASDATRARIPDPSEQRFAPMYFGGVIRVPGEDAGAAVSTVMRDLPDPDDPRFVQHDGQPKAGGVLELVVTWDIETDEMVFLWRIPIFQVNRN